MKKFWIMIGSFLITILTAMTILLFRIDNGIILKATSTVFNAEYTFEYQAWNLIFGLKQNGNVIFEPNTWGIIGFYSLVFAGLIVLIFPMGRIRFMISFLLTIIAFIITAQLTQLVEFRTLNWGDLLVIKPVFGIPMIFALTIKGIMAVMNAIFFTFHPKRGRRIHRR